MRIRTALRIAWVKCSLLCVVLFPASAGTMSVSNSAPAVDAYDIANDGTQTSSDKWWAGDGGTAADKTPARLTAQP